MNTTDLIKQLRIDEGVRKHPYLCTAKKLTIGVGRNLDDVGLSDDEIDYLLANDIKRVEAALDKALPWWRQMTDRRQQALANFCFNVGIGTVLTFKNTLAFLKAGDYDRAADNLLLSKYAKQVGQRAVRVSQMIREG